ncbi:uncharacterized protein DC041_0001849 [Schistosoma bovis]|nr:uncharacterized protein DC041_0001849 [Schistosoma bovis]
MHKIELMNNTDNNHLISNLNQYNEQPSSLADNENLETSRLLYSNQFNRQQQLQNQHITNDFSAIPNVDNTEIRSTHLSDCFV